MKRTATKRVTNSLHCTYLFEQVHQTAERVIKDFKWQTPTSKWLTNPFEQVHRKTEQVIKFSESLTQTGLLTHLNGSSKFPNGNPKWLRGLHWQLSLQTTALHNRPSSFSWNETSIASYQKYNYCLRTHTSIWDLNFLKNYIRKMPRVWWKFLNKMHSAYINNYMHILIEIWPAGNLNMRWIIVWQTTQIKWS